MKIYVFTFQIIFFGLSEHIQGFRGGRELMLINPLWRVIFLKKYINLYFLDDGIL